MELNTIKDLYIHELKDLYSAEKQLLKAIPKMPKRRQIKSWPTVSGSIWSKAKSMWNV